MRCPEWLRQECPLTPAECATPSGGIHGQGQPLGPGRRALTGQIGRLVVLFGIVNLASHGRIAEPAAMGTGWAVPQRLPRHRT